MLEEGESHKTADSHPIQSDSPEVMAQREVPHDLQAAVNFVLGLVVSGEHAAEAVRKYIPQAPKIVKAAKLALALQAAIVPNTADPLKRFESEGRRFLQERANQGKKDVAELIQAVSMELRNSRSSLMAQVRECALRLNEKRFTKKAVQHGIWVAVRNYRNILNQKESPLLDESAISEFAATILGVNSDFDEWIREQEGGKSDDHNSVFQDPDFLKLVDLIEVDWNDPIYKSFDKGH